MKDPPIDPKVSRLLLDILRKELSDDPKGQQLLSRFRKSPKTASQELTNYLSHRLRKDKEFKQRLSGSQDLPGEVRAIVKGGRVDKLIQIAEADTVTIHQGIPIWVGLSAVAVTVATVGVLALVLMPKALPPMGNGFNIAVAEFAMVDANGRATSSDVSSQFSNGLFETIDNETKSLPPALAIELRGPKDVGMAADDSSARKIARDIRATILVYGRVGQDDRGFYSVEPHFYILDTATFNYGSEVTGPDYLGMPITGLTLDEKGKFNSNRKLNGRVQALQSIVRGLAYFYIGDYKSAGDEFQDAANTPDWDEGQEVAYVLLGTARLRAWDLIQNPDVLFDAAAAFTEAHNLAPEYTRSYLGLGAVALAQAQRPNAAGTGIGAVDENQLIEAIKWYSAGLDKDQPPQAYIPTKSALGLGQAYLLGYEFHVRIDNPRESAQKYFSQVVETYQAEHEVSDLDWFAANAHAGLGRLAGLDGDWKAMSEEYRRAVEILEAIQPYPPNLWIARYWSYAAFAEEKRDNRDLARDYYDRAIEAGTGVAGVEELAAWRATRDRLKEGNP